MRRRRALGLSVILAALGVVVAQAGEYHYESTLRCSDCHSMHYSQQHGYEGGAFPEEGEAGLGAGGPFKKLLRKSQHNDLCLSCHDGQTFAPDVRGANSAGNVRAAGALTTGEAPYENWKGHTVGVSALPPGHGNNGVSCLECHGSHKVIKTPLRCTQCHKHHGDPGYRNLPGVTYAKGVNDTTKDVFLRGHTPGDIESNYSVANVDLNEPDPARSAMGEFCRRCHGVFHGRGGDSNMGGAGGTAWKRHPIAGADVGAQGGGHSSLEAFKSRAYRVKVMSPTGEWGEQGSAWADAPGGLTPTCTTCHKAHGNQNPFGLVILSGTGPLTEEGDGAPGVQSLCAQCHEPSSS